jgi:LCP family protein required for cell wall assembly
LVPSLNIINSLAKITSGSSASSNVLGDLFNINPFNSTEQELSKLQGASTGRINILLLGYGGEGHDGAFLTDSQLIISIFPKEKKMSTMNIPRDTYVSDNGAFKKINSVYADAEYRQKGSGARRLASILEGELDSKINYYATIDFKGFKELVDQVGGVEINVRNSFTDYQYPLEGTYSYMYPAPSFTEGLMSMDGATALIYSRSRHAAGVEGGDFARSLRQREVITAVARKALDQGFISNIGKLDQTINTLSKNLVTDLKSNEIYTLGRAFKDFNLDQNVVSWTLQEGDGILCAQNNPNTGYILQYCDGTIMGSSKISSTRNQLQKDFSNILTVGLQSKLRATEIAIVSNKSKVASVLQTNLADLKERNILLNNQYQSITLTSDPQIYAYLIDPSQQDVYDYLLSQNIGLSVIKSGSLPEDKVIPKALSKAKIVFWIE